MNISCNLFTDYFWNFNSKILRFLGKVQEDVAIWQDKVVELSGKISSKDEKGISLSSQIYCQFREDVNFSTLKNDQQITIRGRVIGYDDLLEELKLDQCIIK